MSTLQEIFNEPIDVYSRAQAIADGALIDLNALAPDVCAAHYKCPVACTLAVWELIEHAVAGGADVAGTINDLLWMSRAHVVTGVERSTAFFECALVTDSGTAIYHFKIVCGPAEGCPFGGCEPVITVMLPDEE